MCGIISPRDASVAAEAGANFIGMMLWPNSKRSVSLSTAKEISKVAREHGAMPVGIFVDDDAGKILEAAKIADLEYVRVDALTVRTIIFLVREKQIIYVLHANEDGRLMNQIADEESSLVDWIIVALQVEAEKGLIGPNLICRKLKANTDGFWLEESIPRMFAKRCQLSNLRGLTSVVSSAAQMAFRRTKLEFPHSWML